MLTYDSDTLLHERVCWLLLACSLFAAFSCGCSTSTQLVPSHGYTLELGARHPLVGHVFAGKTHAEVGSSQLQHALQQARYVLLGETHDNRDHHELQAQLLQQFLAAQPTAAVAFEMMDEDDAAALAEATSVPGADELASRVDWAHSGWPDFALYKPIFEVALTAHAKLVAAHPSTAHVRASMTGVDADEARSLHIDAPLPEDQVQAQHEEIRESHCGHADTDMLTAMQRAQVYKDAFMARALTRSGVPTALITGRGHTRNDRAVPYFLARMQAGMTLSIVFIDVDDQRLTPEAYDTSAFDFVVFTPRVSDEDPCETFRKQLDQMQHRALHSDGHDHQVVKSAQRDDGVIREPSGAPAQHAER
jgi:uncharacterized iron-regulated protein